MTIEARAINAFPCDPCSMAQALKDIPGLHCDHCNRLERIDDYIKGATEQRKLDIIRMRQWLEREYAYNGSMAIITPDMIDEFCEAMEKDYD